MQIHWPIVLIAFAALASGCPPHDSTTAPQNTTSTGGSNGTGSEAPTGPCEATACGPQGESAHACPDGTTVAPQCTRNAGGTCEWQSDCAGHETAATTTATSSDAGAETTSASEDAGTSATPTATDAGTPATGHRRRAPAHH